MGIYREKHEKERERGYARDGATHIFTRCHGDFAKCGKMGNSWRLVFLFFPNSKDGEGIWGTLEDALRGLTKKVTLSSFY